MEVQLREEELRIEGRFADASNLTLLARTGSGLQCVYKPTRGERPLWDFPSGTLAAREVATYALARAVGWDVVPESVLREDGPLGPGVCQRYVDPAGAPGVMLVAAADAPEGWCTSASGLAEDGTEALVVHADTPQLQQLALLDVIANNADRKGGHLLTDAGGRVWGIDHGLTFNAEDKLRTVLWGFAGRPVPAALLADLQRLLAGGLEGPGQHLSLVEADAARARLASLVRHARFPQPQPGWPRLPWPPM